MSRPHRYSCAPPGRRSFRNQHRWVRAAQRRFPPATFIGAFGTSDDRGSSRTRDLGLVDGVLSGLVPMRPEIVGNVVGFGQKIAEAIGRRRGATLEACLVNHQALLRDAHPTGAPLRRSTVAAVRARALRSTVIAGGCGSAEVR